MYRKSSACVRAVRHKSARIASPWSRYISATADRAQPDSSHTPKRLNMPPDLNGTQSDGPTAASVDRYLHSKLSHPEYAGSKEFAKGLQLAKQEGLPDISVTGLQGQFLAILLKAMKAERVLEIGTLGGYSTSFISQALPPMGRIDTIEVSSHHATVARQNFVAADLFPFPALHVGPALEILRDPVGSFAQPPGTEEGDSNPGYDVCFIDADKEGMLEYWLECLRLTRKGGVIILDNAIRSGRITSEDAVADPDCKGFRKVYDWVEKDGGKTVLMSAIQTVGAKSWDGFAIAIKL